MSSVSREKKFSISTARPACNSATHNYYIITCFSCLEARCACREAAVKAANILTLVGLAKSKQDPINRGHGAQYFYRPTPGGATQNEISQVTDFWRVCMPPRSSHAGAGCRFLQTLAKMTAHACMLQACALLQPAAATWTVTHRPPPAPEIP